jgi:23S rRNA pseudouridine1911/1915/1917 synthase
MISFTVDEELAGERADLALARLSGLPRAQISRWIDGGHVKLAGAPLARSSRRVSEGDVLEATPPEPEAFELRPEAIPLRILYEDSDLIVVDKAAGMVVHPGPGHSSGTLVHALLHHCGDLAGVGGILRPGIVHRLDRGTTGAMVAAKHDRSHRRLSEQFHEHTVERIYRVAVRAMPAATEGRIEAPIGRHLRDRKRMSIRSRSGRSAATRWTVLERFPSSGMAWLEIRPETGRTHQIRVHLASIGSPVYGDDVYGRGRRTSIPGVLRLERPGLHAAVLGIDHPSSGERMRFEAPLASDLVDLLSDLRRREA